MRVAVLCDIHGNDIALEAVLADARAEGVEQYWVIGDHCALGPDPAAVVERLAALPDTHVTRGNTDRYVVTGDGPPPHLETVRTRPDLIPTYAAIAASFAWTRGYLTATGWLDWLGSLPLEIRTDTPSGHHLLAVHASPGRDDGEGMHPGHSNAELGALFGTCGADVVFVGHTHEAMVRRVDDVLVVNAGSISNPVAPDLRASYAILDASTDRLDIVHRRVAYDHGAFIESVLRSRHPGAEYIIAHQRGERPGRDPHADHVPLRPGELIRI